MHVVLGLVLTVAAFGLALLAHRSMEFGGLMNPAALFLLGFGPLGVTLVSAPFSEWIANFKILFAAFGHDRQRSMQRASEEMSHVARAVRETRLDEADRIIASAESEQVRLLAPFVLARYEPEALRDAVASNAYRWIADVRNADEFFQGLARLSPAFGMIGTIMGLVDLFGNMRDSASLGPGMAMALLATLYGLFLCYCVYMPLSLRIRTYVSAGISEQRLIERAIALISEGRPIHEVRSAFSGALTNGYNSTLPVSAMETSQRP